MKNRLFILLTFFPLPLWGGKGWGSLYASPVECVGTATQMVYGTDTVFVFKDEIHLRSTAGPVDWYNADGTIAFSGMDEVFPDEGCYKAGGSSFCVQLYQDLSDLDFSVEPACENTILHVRGLDSRARTCALSYNALAWDGENWVDSAVTMSIGLTANIILPPLYGATPVKLCYDPEIRAALGLDSVCVKQVLEENYVQAVKMELTSLATARGTEGEKSNERNRPTSQTLIASSDYSGPLEVAFYSNPTPGAKYYRWNIYKSTERIVTRTDKDIRYTFSEPGSYRVVCAVNNDYCSTDSAEMTVAISESYLAAPNVFTPNGDGKNDEFRVAYRSIREFHCWIYNRWGKLVYEWTDPARGWDGTIGGRPAAEGAYFYVIRALGTDAAKNARFTTKASYNRKKLNADAAVTGVYQLSGDINLIRGK